MAKKINKIIIDLGKTALTDEEQKSMQTAIHGTVVKEIKSAGKATAKTADTASKTAKPPAKKSTAKAAAAVETKTANLIVEFTKVSTGNSKLTASFNSKSKTISQSDTITITGLGRGDAIAIDGSSLGNTTISIDISSNPATMNFPPGNFNDSFLIK